MSRERYASETDAEQLAETLGLMRFAPAPVALEAVLAPLFWAGPGRAAVVGLLAVHAALFLALASCSGWLAGFARRPGRRAAAGRLALAIGLASGVAWSALPAVLMPAIGGEPRMLGAALTFGLVALVPLLNASLTVSLAFLLPVVAGAVVCAGRTGDVLDWGTALVLIGVAGLVAAGCRARHRKAAGLIVEGLLAGEPATLLSLLPQEDPEGSGVWFWRTDADLRLTHPSALLAAKAGWPASRLEGKPFERLFLGPAAAVAPSATSTALLKTLALHETFRDRDVEHRDDTGGSVWWRMSGTPAFTTAGDFVGYRGVGWDVSASLQAAERIAELTRHDALTGLRSSEAFRAILARECETATADGSTRAVLLLDLDGFKEVNTSLGHEGGDAVLKIAARRLVEASPRHATVARLSADEFAILYAPSNAASAQALARSLIAAIRTPFEVGDASVALDAGVGIAVTGPGSAESAALFRRADLALGRAKAAGRGAWKVFTPDYEHAIAVQRDLEADIKLGLARGEFQVHYQPLVDLGEGRIVTLEALLRWTSPTRGPVSPVDFIPAAEAGGLIIAIGRFVLLEACKAAAGWREDARVAVNISPKHLRSRDFLADVALALKISGLPPARLEIEITEGVFLDKSDAEGITNLHALRSRGIRIALDDFGTGYSSLNYLTSFPVDKIKIDRSFITHMLDRHEDRAVVDAILTLARKLGLSVTAEGVETPEQALALKIRRCNDIQGFLASKARPAAEVEAMFDGVPEALRRKVPALFESALAAVVAMRRQSAA